MRTFRKSIAVLGATAAAVIGFSSNASAADTPWFKFTGIKDNWHCSDTVKQDRAYVQQCVIINGTAFQGATIVTVNAPESPSAATYVIEDRYTRGGQNCYEGLQENKTLLCLSATQRATPGAYVQGFGAVWTSGVGTESYYSPTKRIS
ncbi:hypothetical protein C9F11_02810 [Streptomyces sp. YIM 121038]|uniref:hypothetical protein n=1 Tax=Streptomyces sp. YIM 121038 TaxID=2136401 RepID=UPI001110989E|nr:hypothetical protein [Streptomyces sp. YIM 121038]QCX74265.1 hypothetical protein C9F11_02810 [Streptomyces sp. YIM 121038]